MRRKRILLTRSLEQNQQDCQLIDPGYFKVYSIPLIEAKTINYSQNSATLETIDWIFFTSSNAVHYFFEAVKDEPLVMTKKIAAIGIRTAEKVKKLGIAVDFMPSIYTSSDFIKEWQLSYGKKPQRILLPKSDLARSNIKKNLADYGHLVEERAVYENRLPAKSREYLLEMFEYEQLDIALFSSPSAWQRFYEITKNKLSENLKIGAIGPVTQQVIALNGRDAIVPDNQTYTMDQLIKTILTIEKG